MSKRWAGRPVSAAAWSHEHGRCCRCRRRRPRAWCGSGSRPASHSSASCGGQQPQRRDLVADLGVEDEVVDVEDAGGMPAPVEPVDQLEHLHRGRHPVEDDHVGRRAQLGQVGVAVVADLAASPRPGARASAGSRARYRSGAPSMPHTNSTERTVRALDRDAGSGIGAATSSAKRSSSPSTWSSMVRTATGAAAPTAQSRHEVPGPRPAGRGPAARAAASAGGHHQAVGAVGDHLLGPEGVGAHHREPGQQRLAGERSSRSRA